jgi:arginyl-tRNA synthetase
MYTKQKAMTEVASALKKAIGKSFTVTVDMLETPPELNMGDLAFPVFEYAKGEKRNPVEIAAELAAKIGPGTLFEKVEATGPYVNFYYQNNALAESVLKELSAAGAKYGNSILGKDTSVLVEYAQPNTHKEFHVGHVRNAVFGQSIVHVLKANGYKVTAASYIGDIGAHVAKALWGMKKFHEGEDFPKEHRAEKLGAVYTQATKFVAEHEEAKKEIAVVQQELEDRKEPWQSLWKETRIWSIDDFKKHFAQLRVTPDVWYFESDVEEDGKKMVQKMLTDGIAKKSEGAVIVDLEDADLGACLILKSDGSSLYATKDIALAYKKEKDYSPDRQVFVVDTRQSLYFKQLFEVLRRMGFKGSLSHLAYDMVTLPDGAMSSRQGNIVTFTQLRDDMIDRLEKETRERHDDWSNKKVHQVASDIAIAAIQFMMLRQDPETIITFDIEEAMSFDGFTAPYILYTIARIEGIKRQSKTKSKIEAGKLSHNLEAALLRKLAEYPLLVQRVGTTFHVSSVAVWAFETAKLFSEYYHQVRILDGEEDSKAARLALCDGIQVSLRNALGLLGIKAVDEM